MEQTSMATVMEIRMVAERASRMGLQRAKSTVIQMAHVTAHVTGLGRVLQMDLQMGRPTGTRMDIRMGTRMGTRMGYSKEIAEDFQTR